MNFGVKLTMKKSNCSNNIVKANHEPREVSSNSETGGFAQSGCRVYEVTVAGQYLGILGSEHQPHRQSYPDAKALLAPTVARFPKHLQLLLFPPVRLSVVPNRVRTKGLINSRADIGNVTVHIVSWNSVYQGGLHTSRLRLTAFATCACLSLFFVLLSLFSRPL